MSTILFPTGLKGLSDSKWSGILGSVAACVGIDLHSVPGIIKVHQKLAKDSDDVGANVVTALCRVALAVSDGSTLWFSYTDGNIWRRTAVGVWLLVHTTAATGADGCLGAAEYDGYIYWATAESLNRIPVANIATAAEWTANAAAGVDWATFTNKDSEFHPMIVRGVRLFIGDGNYVAKVYDSAGHTFKADALDLRTPLRIKSMIGFDIDLLIGTYVDDNVNKTELIRWDTYDEESWQTSDAIEENGINAFIRDDNNVYAQCGQFGRIYWYNGVNLVPFKRIPGAWSPTQFGQVYPNAVAVFNTIPVFGFSNDPAAENTTGDPSLQGVYSFGSYSKDYLKVLDLSFPVSVGVSGIEIGAILVMGMDLLVSWKNQTGPAYGVDALSWAAKYPSAYIETLVLTPLEKRHFIKSLLKVFIDYISMPVGVAPQPDCDVTIKYKRKYDAAWSAALATVKDVNLLQIRAKQTVPDIAALQLRFDFVVNGNDAPEVESIGFKDNTE